jgi:hypothetical protein
LRNWEKSPAATKGLPPFGIPLVSGFFPGRYGANRFLGGVGCRAPPPRKRFGLR